MDDTFLVCKKDVVLKKSPSRKTCKWEGVLSDYIEHVRKSHPVSYIKVEPGRPANFSWKLPQRGDQMDTGIIFCENRHYIYKIAYKGATTKEIHFVLQSLDGQVNWCCFGLQKKHGGEVLALKKRFETSNFAGEEKGADACENGVKISKIDVDDYINTYGYFEWSLCIY